MTASTSRSVLRARGSPGASPPSSASSSTCEGIDAAVGDVVLLGTTTGLDGVPAEVVGIEHDRARCMPLGRLTGLRVG